MSGNAPEPGLAPLPVTADDDRARARSREWKRSSRKGVGLGERGFTESAKRVRVSERAERQVWLPMWEKYEGNRPRTRGDCEPQPRHCPHCGDAVVMVLLPAPENQAQPVIECPACRGRVAFLPSAQGGPGWVPNAPAPPRLTSEDLAELAGEMARCRPCVRVGCRYNLYLDVLRGGAVKFNHEAGAGPENVAPGGSCAIDAPGDGLNLIEIGKFLNLTRERVRQIEAKAIARIAAVADRDPDGIGEWAEEGGVRRKRMPGPYGPRNAPAAPTAPEFSDDDERWARTHGQLSFFSTHADADAAVCERIERIYERAIETGAPDPASNRFDDAPIARVESIRRTPLPPLPPAPNRFDEPSPSTRAPAAINERMPKPNRNRTAPAATSPALTPREASVLRAYRELDQTLAKVTNEDVAKRAGISAKNIASAGALVSQALKSIRAKGLFDQPLAAIPAEASDTRDRIRAKLEAFEAKAETLKKALEILDE